jgi:hypothetical protein
MGLSFVYATGPCQRSLSQVRVPWFSRPYFAVSDLRLPFSSPPTTRRLTVEVFDPALGSRNNDVPPFITRGEPNRDRTVCLLFCLYPLQRNTCQSYSKAYPLPWIRALASRCLAVDYSGFQESCHNMNSAVAYSAIYVLVFKSQENMSYFKINTHS